MARQADNAKIILTFAVFLVLFSFGGDAMKLPFENCGPAPIQVRDLNLKFSYRDKQQHPTASLTASYDNKNNYTAIHCKSKFTVQLRLQKKVGSALPPEYAEIPCIGNIGSCTQTIICKNKYACPWKPGKNTVTRQQTIPAGFKFPAILREVLGNGKYRFFVDVREKMSNERVACVLGEASIKL